MINKNLITKCEKASQKYLETLRRKELNENTDYLKWLESRHEDQIFIIKKSNEKLKVPKIIKRVYFLLNCLLTHKYYNLPKF